MRAAQHARYLVDGAAYFAAVADALEAAQHTIYIADWWLSPEVRVAHRPLPQRPFRAFVQPTRPCVTRTIISVRVVGGCAYRPPCPPLLANAQVYLKRPCEDFPEYRLDRLLARKAGQGVKVYVILYKEVLNTMPVDSLYSKTALKRLGALPCPAVPRASAPWID